MNKFRVTFNCRVTSIVTDQIIRDIKELHPDIEVENTEDVKQVYRERLQREFMADDGEYDFELKDILVEEL